MSGQPGTVQRGRVWDPLVRLTHWSLVACFTVSWFERSEAELHENAGKIALGLIVFRIIWGLIGPASARFETFVTGPIKAFQYLYSILRGRPSHFLGHNPAGAAMIGALLISVSMTSISGVLMTTTALWGNALIEWIHGTAALVSVYLIAAHLIGVVLASFQHRENLPLAMISGRKWVPIGTQPFLGDSRFEIRQIAASVLILTLAIVVWGGGESLFNASYWRMEKIIRAAFTERACEVSAIMGPNIEIYPHFILRYDIAVAGQKHLAVTKIDVSSALQRRPKLDLSGFIPQCNATAAGS